MVFDIDVTVLQQISCSCPCIDRTALFERRIDDGRSAAGVS